jgi:hypothetical protein
MVPTSARPVPSAVRAGVRGLVAAMAMTGMRTAAAGLSAEDRSPPEEIVNRHAPSALQRLPRRQRSAVTELVHWSYGGAGGAGFGLLPARLRRQVWAGPAYGLAFWLGYELLIAPMLDVDRARQRPFVWRVLLAADHVLYGVIVAGRLGEGKPGGSR